MLSVILNVLGLICLLFLCMLANIVAGLYYNVGKVGYSFDKAKLSNGIVKALIIAFCVVVIAIVTHYIPIADISAEAILKAGIGFYTGLIAIKITKILGYKEDETIKPEVSE